VLDVPVEEAHGEQRRIVTILFADLTSSTAIADTMDPEDVRALLAMFFSTMAREIHRHGGTVEKYIGDAVMAVFGLPVAHEDDPVRAIRAALDMQAALRYFNEERREFDASAPELHMRIGINTGEVVAASGSAEGRDFLVTGDPVNVAARLQQLAAPDSVLVGPRAYRGATGAIVFRQLPSVTPRGKSRPMRVYEALALAEQSPAPAQRPRGIQGLKAPLIGRDVELSLLRSLYARVAGERRPHLVTILGVPGVGKTRLAREFIAGIRASATEAIARAELRPLVLEGRCPQYGEMITYWPLAEMLRALCDFTAMTPPAEARAKLLAKVREALVGAERDESPEVIAAYLGHTIGIESQERRQALLPSDSQQLQEGLLRAWRVFFEALAAYRPVLVLMDDIHWADDVLLELLEYVAAKASNVPLLLICPARPELLERQPNWGGGKRNYAMLNLEALTPEESERLARELLPGDGVPESLRVGIQRRAEGNPFFFEEIVRMLVDRGILLPSRAAGELWRIAPECEGSNEVSNLDIPDTVQGVLAARLDLLAERERDILQHAAVIGRYFWPSALHVLHADRDGTLGAVLASLEAKEMIHESERSEASAAPEGEPLYTFNHALTREVAYTSIPRTRRAHEHQRVAEWLETLAHSREAEFADLIAQHYRQYYVQANLTRSRTSARRLAVRDKVLYYLTLAGDQGLIRHAAAKAERYYTDALMMLEEDALAEDVPARVALFMKRGDARWTQIRGDDAWADYRDALRLWSAYTAFLVDAVGQDGQPEGRAFAPVAADGLVTAIGDLTIESMDRLAMPLDWRSWGLRLYRLLVLTPTRNSSFFQQPPSHEDLLPYLEEGLQLAERLGQNETLEGAALLTAKAFFWWSWGEQRGERELMDALHDAREAVRITEALDDPHNASEALDALGNLQAITADLRGNVESQSRRLHWARRIDDINELTDISSEACTAQMLVGNYEQAVEYGRQALELANSTDADLLRARVLARLMLTRFEWDQWPETIRLGRQLQAVSTYPGSWLATHQRWALLAWAIAHARMGDRDESDRIAQRASLIADREPVQFFELYKARLALARGATKEARQTLLEAVDARSGKLMLPMFLAELAELGARSGDRDLYGRFSAQALELGWRSGARKALAQATRARGIIALADTRWDDAQCDLEGALRRYQELGCAWEEARTRYALSGLFQRRADAGDADLARAELTGALALFERLHAVRDIARARAALAGGDVRLP
jgi:class 3 adenylate cyclase/tetratricopeptide (TPR) repeat protein